MKTKVAPKPSINIITLGCSKNLVDSEVLYTQLKGNGLEVTHEAKKDKANIVVINTCGFIDNAKQESIDTILRYADAKEAGKIDKLYVTGCLSHRYKDDLEREIPMVDSFFGTNELPRLLKALKADYKHELVGERLLTTPAHYAYLKIAEGCDRPCSFCAIPLMRGKHVSTPMEELVKEANSLAKKGTIKAQVQTYGFFLPDADDNNVIAEIRGSEFPDQYITLGGHLDSWDVNEGAHDDGAGIVQTMEVLRVMKALNYKPKCSIRFVLFANEENAARGGKEYANQAKINKENHIFVIESDEGGFTPRSIGITAPPAQFARFQTWTPLLKPYGSEITFGGGGTDIAPMAGINKESILAGLIPDSQRYFDLHHAKTDVFENVNKRELHLGAVNMAAIIYLIDKYGVK